jgi:hypothetical protein
MAEELLIEQQVETPQQQPDPPIKKLYQGLNADGKYTKSFDEFKKQYSSPEAIDKLYNGLKEDGDYTKTKEDFQSQYFSDTEKKKTKVGSIDFASSSLDTKLPSQKQDGIVSLSDSELEIDPISKSKAAKEDLRAGDYTMAGEENIFTPNEERVTRGKKTIEDLEKQGYDANFRKQFEDFPEEAFAMENTSKEKLSKLYKDNPIEFNNIVNSTKTVYDIGKTDVHSANEFNHLNNVQYNSLPDFISGKQRQIDIIDHTLSGEQRDKAKQRLQQNSAPFINANDPDLIAEYQQSPVSGKVDANQYAGLKTLQVFDPEKYKHALSIINADIPETYELPLTGVQSPVAVSAKITTTDKSKGGRLSQETIDQQIGKETMLRQLGEMGRGNLLTNLTEEQHDLEAAYKNSESPEIKQQIQQQYLQNQKVINGVKQEATSDDTKFPLTAQLKFDNQVKELVQDAGKGAVEYGANRFLVGMGNGMEGIEDVVTNMFGSEKDNALLQMKRMGEGANAEQATYLPENLRGTGSPVIMQPTKELKDAAKAIMKGRKLSELSPDEKKQLNSLVANNQDKIETITNPEAGKSKNFFSKSTLYSNAGFTGDIAAFMYKLAGAKSLGLSGKAAEMAVLSNDGYTSGYNSATAEGASPEMANARGLLHGGVMTLAGTVSSKWDVVKDMLGASKSPISKEILGLGEKGWDAIVKKNQSTINRIASGAENVLKSNAKLLGTYGVGTTIANDLVDKNFFDKPISGEQMIENAFHATKDMAIGSVALAGAGFLSHVLKNPVTLKDKAAIWDIGDNPDISKAKIDEQVISGALSPVEGEARKKAITEVSSLIEKVPTQNDKGKPLTDQQKVNYLYNSVLKNKAKEAAKDLPENQSEKAEMTAMVADHKNGLLLEEPTDKQLESRLSKLEKSLIPETNAEGKTIEIPEKEKRAAEAEITAIKEYVKDKSVVTEPPMKVPEETTIGKEQPVEEKSVITEPPMTIPEGTEIGAEKIQKPNEVTANTVQETTTGEPNKEANPTFGEAGEGEKVPPGVPPTEPVGNEFLYKGGKDTRVRGLMSHIQESENVSSETKKAFKDSGIEYNTANAEEAQAIAKDIITAFGKDDALTIARQNDMHPSVRSAIFAESINEAYKKEQAAKTPEEKQAAAQEWKDIATEYAKVLTEGGQFTAQVAQFYKTSPLGFVLKENERRVGQFEEYFKQAEPDFKKLWEMITEHTKGKEFVETKLEEMRKEERKATRKKRDAAIDQFFDKAIKDLEGGTYSTLPFAPQAMKLILEGAKKSVKAGDRIIDVVKVAIEELDKLAKGAAWEKAKIEEYLTKGLEKVAGEGKEKSYEELLKNKKEELERRIREKDFSAESYKEKKDPTEKEKAAIEEYKAVKDEYDELKKKSPEWAEKKARQYIDNFRGKIKGMNDAEKEEVIRRSVKKLIENGALQYEDFKKIIADVIGIKELTPEEIKRVEELVKKINEVDVAEEAMVANPSKETIEAFEKAKKEGLKSGLELHSLTQQKADIVSTLKSIITGALLGVPTLVKNVAQNVLAQSTMRFPRALIHQISEAGVYGISAIGNKLFGSKLYKPNSNLLEAQKGYFGKGKKGLSLGLFNFMKGTQEKDYFDRNAYQSTLSPRQAIKDLKLWKKGEKFLTPTEVLDRRIRATYMSRQADFILRGMGLGDTPQRWAAEGSTAIQIATRELGLTNPDTIDAFMLSPEKVSYKHFIDEGKSKKEAGELAKEIKERITYEGDKSVFQEDNLLSKASQFIDKGLQGGKDDRSSMKAVKGIAAIGKTLTFPFVKIPANVYWQMFKVANPELSFVQSIYQANEARKYEKKGDHAKAREYYNKASESISTAILGYGISLAVSGLVANGYVRTSNDKDTKAKESAGEKAFGKQNQLNIGRMFGGKDYWIDLSWFGAVGTILDVKARMAEDKKQAAAKGDTEQNNFLEDIVDNMEYSASSALNTLVFDQAAKTVDAIKGGEKPLKVLANNTINTVHNIFTGATYAAISKGLLPEEPRLKGDTVMEEIKNNALQRNVLARIALNLYKPGEGQPPAKISIWGEPIKKDNSFGGVTANVLGFEAGSENKFGAILYDDARRTANPNFFPQPEDAKLSVNGQQVTLTQKEKDDLDTEVGKARKMLVGSFVYDMSTPYGNKKYSQMDDKEKVAALKIVYDLGREYGQTSFKEKYPAYKEAEFTEPTDEEMEKKANDATFKADMESILESNPKYQKK